MDQKHATTEGENKVQSPVAACEPSMKGIRLPLELAIRALSDWALFPRLMTIQEASWATGIPVKTLYKLNAEGKLRNVAKKIGKQIRFDRDGLLALWTSSKKAAAE